jgi:hypothetical protein
MCLPLSQSILSTPSLACRYGHVTPLDCSISEDIKALANSVNQFTAITKAQYLELGNRLSLLEKKNISPISNAEASEGVDNMD